MRWFTSDTHFGHHQIITFCGRPFRGTDEMDEFLIEQWNAHVMPDDEVYHLGDVGFCSQGRARDILNRLNGKKHLVIGNHDKMFLSKNGKPHTKGWPQWEWMKYYHEVRLGRKDGKRFVLCHYPFGSWHNARVGWVNLHGHSHGNYPFNGKQLDVGVDYSAPELLSKLKYRPFSEEDVWKIVETREFIPVDHHK